MGIADHRLPGWESKQFLDLITTSKDIASDDDKITAIFKRFDRLPALQFRQDKLDEEELQKAVPHALAVLSWSWS